MTALLEIFLKTKTETDKRILGIIEPVANDMGYDVVRIRVMSGKRSVLQIMAARQRDGLMNVDDCAQLSHAVSSTLEVEDPLRDAYVLEVSSPGLDRPLTSLKDFEAFEGYLARIELDRLVEGRKRFRGVLAGIDGNNVDINLDGDDETAQIPFDWISEAKLLITDELIKAGQEKKDNAKKEAAQKATQSETD